MANSQWLPENYSMNSKTTIGLVVALLIATGAIWWVSRSETAGNTTPVSNEPKALFDKPIEDPVGFETVKGGEAFVFEKAGENWRMKSPLKSGAQSSTVASDVSRIAGLKYTKSFAASDPERPSDKQTSLGNPVRVVKLTGKDGRSQVIKIGSMQALATKTYVQKEGDDTIYLVDGDLASDFNRRLVDYRGTRIVDAPVTELVKMEATGAAAWSLSKTDNTWTLETPIKARADQAKAAALAGVVANLSAQTFVEDTPQSLRVYGLDSPAMTLTATLEKKTPKPPPPPPASTPETPEFDTETRVVAVRIGGAADDKVFAQLEDPENPSVFQIPKTTYTQLAVPLTDLRDKRITDASTPKAQKISLTQEARRTDLVKNAGRWEITPASGAAPQPADLTAVDDLLKAVGGLTVLGFEQAVEPAFGLTSPRAEIELTIEGRTMPARIAIGGMTPSKTGVYVRNIDEDFVAVVAADSVEPLLVGPQAFLSRDLLTFARDRASKLEITSGGVARTIENQGGVWNFTAPLTGNADPAAALTLLSSLSNLRGRKVIAAATEAGQYGLTGADALRVSVWVNPQPKPQPTTATETQPVEPPDPPVKYTVVLAKAADNKVVAMLEGGQTIAEVDAKAFDDLSAELFNTRVVVLQTDKVTGVTIGGANDLAFAKDGTKWQLAGESSFPVDPAKMIAYIDAIRDLKAKRFVKYAGANLAEYGLDKPVLTVAVRSDTAPFELLVSERGPTDDTRFATSSAGRDRIFVISKEDFDKLNKQARDFQTGSAPAMPTPPPGIVDHSGHGH